tara:strand:- start:306 stop:515 length:210 start_codon:yes stop_codon:yes gene_type:complete
MLVICSNITAQIVHLERHPLPPVPKGVTIVSLECMGKERLAAIALLVGSVAKMTPQLFVSSASRVKNPW